MNFATLSKSNLIFYTVSILVTNGLKLNNSHTITLRLQVFTLSDLKLLLPKISNSTAPNDVIPTSLCKIVLTNSPDYFISLIILTLQTGYFPNQFKQGVVRPLIKNSNLDPELSSYRPVTNLRFMSKVVERVVFEQINLYLESNNLRCRYQSAFCWLAFNGNGFTESLYSLLCCLDGSLSVMYI